MLAPPERDLFGSADLNIEIYVYESGKRESFWEKKIENIFVQEGMGLESTNSDKAVRRRRKGRRRRKEKERTDLLLHSDTLVLARSIHQLLAPLSCVGGWCEPP